jgi:8-oxo-dGTP diphosphatase
VISVWLWIWIGFGIGFGLGWKLWLIDLWFKEASAELWLARTADRCFNEGMSEPKREYSELKLARGLIFHQGHVLLVKNNQSSGHFFLPGGKVDPGESVTRALSREFQEEIAWAVKPSLFVGCFEHAWQAPKKSGALVDILEINFIWLCERLDGDLSLENPPSMEDKISFQWVKLSELDDLKLYPADMKILLPRIAKEAGQNKLQTFWGTSLKTQSSGH